MKRPIIGILTWREGKRFAEPTYFRRLLKAGQELGCTAFLFSPNDVLGSGKQVRGYVPGSNGGWQARIFDRPDAVFDRYRYTPTQAFKNYVAFRRTSNFLYANNRLANKWRVHEVLHRDPRMHRWLPETHLYNRQSLVNMLGKHPLLYVKPLNGTGGRNILSIEKRGDELRLLGRNKQRAKVSTVVRDKAAAQRWVDRWTRQEKYIVQQGLRLQLVPSRAVDMRLLIQKNGEGEWSITGHGIRVGPERSATSNLHGGGRAIPVSVFLRPRFGEERTAQIVHDCEQLAFQTAETLEDHFGRMVEFGLDIGIDVDGRAWLIEVNPKPAREIFREMGATGQYKNAITRPLEYAIYLAKTQGREGREPLLKRKVARG
ncbi:MULTISPECIES: YheC/YheD family protein [Brevibacillus]|uniref:YheC/YheD family endospore coat-associated protein n=1 Tax=Brevibacillus TaxID=55080 RepID=UPI00156B2C52|nr:YheC/YheD family protein [Brevibacillus sp. RS1.1]NRR03009.1 YheC/YheD family protein [Brevibacillus sp. RS1.1]